MVSLSSHTLHVHARLYACRLALTLHTPAPHGQSMAGTSLPMTPPDIAAGQSFAQWPAWPHLRHLQRSLQAVRTQITNEWEHQIKCLQGWGCRVQNCVAVSGQQLKYALRVGADSAARAGKLYVVSCLLSHL